MRNVLVAVTMVALVVGAALGEAPELINYQGILKNTGGTPITGTVTLTFRFYDAYTGGNFLFGVQQNNVTVDEGLYNVLVGSGGQTTGTENSLSEVFRDNVDVWMSIEVNLDGEMDPRQRIASVPYALHGGEWSDDGTYIYANNAPNVVVTDDGKLGVGTTTPTQELDVNGSVNASAYYGDGSNLTSIDADTVDGVHAAELEESSEIDSDIAAHAAVADAHHTKTTLFSELTDTATDGQIPNDITINYAGSAGDADTVDGVHAAELEESSEIDSDIAAHAAVADAHHAKTTLFSELTDTATDGQIPNDITINYAASAGDADTVDGHHYDSSWSGQWTDMGTYIQANGATPNVVVTDDGKLGVGTTTPTLGVTFSGGLLRQGGTVYGANSDTHVNLGTECVTGKSGQNYNNVTVGGGYQNSATGGRATVSGGSTNTASGSRATVGGGENNVAPGDYATVGGGQDNVAGTASAYDTVGGGFSNEASGLYSTVGGGEENAATNWDATVGGGWDNLASGEESTVAGGYLNTASGTGATVCGGTGNTAAGTGATVIGGADNVNLAQYSVVGGHNMRLSDHSDRTFLWGHSDLPIPSVSCPPGSFIVYSGDVGIGTITPDSKLDVSGTVTADGLDVSGDVGVGISGPDCRLHVRDDISGSGIDKHLMRIVNASTASDAKALAIKVGISGDPTTANNFITFYNGSNDACGALEGDGSGGLTLHSGGGDYAEWMARLDSEEQIEPGDVVGLFGDKVSKRTEGADVLMVVSSRPIVLGNDPGEDARGAYERIAFIGQVEVKVSGSVSPGDLIVGSGQEDGTAVAMAPEAMSPDQVDSVVGQALVASDEPGMKRVKVLVGLEQGERALSHRMSDLEEVNASLLAQNAALTQRLASLETQMSRAQARHGGAAPGCLWLGCIGLVAGFMIQRKRGGR